MKYLKTLALAALMGSSIVACNLDQNSTDNRNLFSATQKTSASNTGIQNEIELPPSPAKAISSKKARKMAGNNSVFPPGAGN